MWVFMGYNPQESLENTINTMGTLLGVHPIVPWISFLAVKETTIFTTSHPLNVDLEVVWNCCF